MYLHHSFLLYLIRGDFMKITYYGHSCFQFENENNSIIFDPYADGSVPGLKLPENLHANAIYCSHQHADHNAESLIHIDGKSIWPVQLLCVPHDDQEGRLRGFSNITKVNIDDITVAHMGDIGRILKDGEWNFLKDVDVMLIPVGGYYTIDASIAKKIIDTIKPHLTILMHYRDENIGYDVLEDINEIVHSQLSDCMRMQTSTYVYEKTDTQRIITLKPFQE